MRPSGADADKVEREFFDLFIGIGRGELMPYGSYYLAGFLHERPLARLREDLSRLGIERAEGNTNRKITPPSCARSCPASPAANSRRPPDADRQLFEKHLAPWLGRFFADLERAESADFYRRVGALGRRVHGDRIGGFRAH